MKFKKIPAFDKQLSIMGLGTMRLPQKEIDGVKHIDQEKAVELIRYAIDHDVTYIDTAKPYHRGQSEKTIGIALREGYREKVNLVTKLTPWMVKKKEDIEIFFEEQLEDLQTEYIDIYLLHYLNKDNWKKFLSLDIFAYLEKKKKEGRIKHIGFSFHDNYETFVEIIDSYNWDCCQVQMNILDAEIQATMKGIKYAGSKNISVIVMEPLKGGKLACNIPAEVMELCMVRGNKSLIELSFEWLYDIPEVAVILSGASDIEQLNQNMKIFNGLSSVIMQSEELQLVGEIVEIYKKNIKVDCSGCNYCMPCPSLVLIPTIFQLYNEAHQFRDYKKSLMDYWSSVMTRGGSGDECVSCGICVEKCPQGLSIPSLVKDAHQFILNQGNVKKTKGVQA